MSTNNKIHNKRVLALVMDSDTADTDKHFSGNTFITDNGYMYQIVRDLDFSPEIKSGETYNMKLIEYNSKSDFISNRYNYSVIDTFGYTISDEDLANLTHTSPNIIYKECMRNINGNEYILTMRLNYYKNPNPNPNTNMNESIYIYILYESSIINY